MTYYSDDVRGVIVGGDTYTGYTYYDGRKQGGACVGYSEREMIDACTAQIAAFKAEYKGFPTYLYQDDRLWEIRTNR